MPLYDTLSNFYRVFLHFFAPTFAKFDSEKVNKGYYSFSWKDLRAELHPIKLLNRKKILSLNLLDRLKDYVNTY